MKPLQREVGRGLARARWLCHPSLWLAICAFAAFHTMGDQGTHADVLTVLVILGAGLVPCRPTLHQLEECLANRAEPDHRLRVVLELELKLAKRLYWTLVLASPMLLTVIARRLLG